MKRILSLTLAVILLLSMAACAPATPDGTEPETTATPTIATKPTQKPTEPTPEPTEPTPETTEPTPEPTEPTPEPTQAPTEPEKETESDLVDGMRPEFKEAMDSYEAFYDEYCEFMKAYSENPYDLTLLGQYAEIVEKATEAEEAFEEWDSDDLNSTELQYYMEVTARIAQKLAEISG